ncbi:MAG: hypothetical protein CL609_24065 [Anaerolineaceae bacterium]|nr:hypothetical protein [Anaerolineaceae bacterium]
MIKAEHIYHYSDSHCLNKVKDMSKFPAWFNRAYKRWSRSQPGEEDFLAFCDLLGQKPVVVLAWLHGETVPHEAELLPIAALLGMDVYGLLNEPEPDPELLKIFHSFSHLTGEFRLRLAQALFEVRERMGIENLSFDLKQTETIIDNVFKKYGLT